jgi:patatin-related protein
MPDAVPSPVPRDEELRLALVMNGGVSLAVWMGGVAFEFNRLVGETHPVYQGLLQLTRTRARIDVISGTSAGGINGAALALGSVFDTSLWPLREVWLASGSFDALLRDPADPDPASLLNGDGVFLPALENAFDKLVRFKDGQPAPAADVPMDLMLTTTLLRGEPQARLDDLGERVDDANHRARFHFRRPTRPAPARPSAPPPPVAAGRGTSAAAAASADPFLRPTVALELAQAARASASFPIAFEPRWARAGAANLESISGKQAKPLALSRFLIDGGVLDNKPIEGALQAIFKLPPRTNVRRVLAYVTPDPASSARAAHDTQREPPKLAEVALASLVTIKSAESIADQLQLIDDSNDSVRHRRDTLAGLVSNLPPERIDAMAEDLFALYRERRIEGLFDYVIEQIQVGLTQRANGTAPGGFGNRTRAWLKATWRTAENAEMYWDARIPTLQTRWSFTLGDAPAGWTWGRFPLDNACRFTMELLRRTQRLRHLVQPTRDVHTEVEPAATDVDWERHDATRRASRLSAPNAQVQTDSLLGEAWQEAYRLQELLAIDRAGGEENFEREVPRLKPTLAGQGTDAEQQKGARDWLYERLVENPADGAQKSYESRRRRRTERYAAIAKAIVALLKRLDQPILDILRATQDKRPDVMKAVDELAHLHAYLFSSRELDDQAPSDEALMRRVLHLEVVIYAVLGHEPEPSALVELVQVSARGASPWGGATEPAHKLAGMQLAHFGAFYRKSWRANDWMVGRLDAIARLVRVALNPDRLHRLYCRGAVPVGEVTKALYELAVSGAGPTVRSEMELQWSLAAQRLADELAFLARSEVRVPETLPVASELLVRRLHLEVLCRELPDLAHAVEDDLLAGARNNGPAAKLALQVDRALSPVWKLARLAMGMVVGARNAGAILELASGPALKRLDAKEAVRIYTDPDYRIGAERVENEAGTDSMTRTAARTMVVAHAALASQQSGLMFLARLLKPLRFPMRALHLLADRLMHDSRTSAAITAALLVCGVLLVLGAGQFKAPDKAPAGLAEVGWALLFAWTATALLRRRLAMWLVLLLAAVTLLVFGDPAKTLVPLAAIAALLWLMSLRSWLGPALLAAVLIWWSTGSPSCADVLAAARDDGWASVVDAITPRLPGGTCSLAEGQASRGALMVRLLLTLGGVTVLAMLARLGDTPSRARAVAQVNRARGGLRGWLDAGRELFRK